LSRLRDPDESRLSIQPLTKRQLDAIDMSVGECGGPADRKGFSDNDDWQLAVARRDRLVGNPRCNKPDHGRSQDRQKRVRGIQLRDKNADEEFLDEILPSCSRTLPGITVDDKDAFGDDDEMNGLSGSRQLFRFLRFEVAAYI
jgi:hypothetical protein